MSELRLYPLPAALTVLLAAHGVRKGSLSTSGALAALVAGYGTLANPLPTFGVMLLVFYLTGSRATKVKAGIKATLERELVDSPKKSAAQSDAANHKAHAGGQRDAMQVLCNSLTAFISAVLFRILYGNEGLATSLTAQLGIPPNALEEWKNGAGFCAISPRATDGWSRTLLLLALGHFACCMGDTLASELGILARSKPVLVLNPFRQVPPGTNGGISPLGTLMSLLGGLLIGITAALTTYLSNSECSAHQGAASWLRTKETDDHYSWLAIVALGGLGGLLGSMIDSLMGATLQRTYYSKETKQVLLGRLPPQERAKPGAKQSEWVVITGNDVLTNNQVNLLSSILTAAIVAYVGNTVLV
ncbi:hypothetical protein OC845_002263 [Tilletia horrida]|nr:hypothetical protein OC845_002263 [Tilletia horrida]